MAKIALTTSQAYSIYDEILNKFSESQIDAIREYAAMAVAAYEGSLAANFSDDERKADANIRFLQAYMPATSKWLQNGYNAVERIIANKLEEFGLMPNPVDPFNPFDGENSDTTLRIMKAFSDGRLYVEHKSNFATPL